MYCLSSVLCHVTHKPQEMKRLHGFVIYNISVVKHSLATKYFTHNNKASKSLLSVSVVFPHGALAKPHFLVYVLKYFDSLSEVP